jgi:tryptophan synthase beta subunit
MDREAILLVNLSGRGDKDLDTILKAGVDNLESFQ